ncbi:UNKNOWN [Stylonychia lemnae]|uniref:Uncharacterized protein n=1 Tax=Stylonychia lemnae TaxID=5949 RepID=A0A077ZSD4_STYLE|nr:UNKNOWN [Stylonychia lemnae]|eukprot:CDW71366.1 UNKNOWN [Stylonychia lemnae]
MDSTLQKWEHFQELRYVNSYFAYTDFEKPIKRYIEDRFYLPIEPYTKKGADVFIKRGYTQLSDSLLPFQNPDNYTFTQITNIKYFQADLNRRGPGLVQINVRLDVEVEIYTRQIYSIYILLFQIGGTIKALILIGHLLTRMITEKMLYSELIHRLFFVQKEHKAKLLANRRNRPPGDITNQSGDSERNRFEIHQDPTLASPMNDEGKEKRYFFREIAEDITLKIGVLKKAKINIKELMFFLCLCKKKSRTKTAFKKFLFNRAADKIKKQFDIVKLYKRIQELEILQSAFVNPLQKELMRYHESYIVNQEDFNLEIHDSQVDQGANQKGYKRDLGRKIVEYLSHKRLNKIDRQVLGSLLGSNYNFQSFDNRNKQHHYRLDSKNGLEFFSNQFKALVENDEMKQFQKNQQNFAAQIDPKRVSKPFQKSLFQKSKKDSDERLARPSDSTLNKYPTIKVTSPASEQRQMNKRGKTLKEKNQQSKIVNILFERLDASTPQGKNCKIITGETNKKVNSSNPLKLNRSILSLDKGIGGDFNL